MDKNNNKKTDIKKIIKILNLFRKYDISKK